MRDNRARPPGRKLSLVAPLVIAALVAVVLALAWMIGRPPREPAATAPAPAPAPTAAPAPIATPEPVMLTRRELISEVEAIARAYALGAPMQRQSADPLEARGFRIAIPFGCEGPQTAPGAAQAHYEFDAETRTLRLSARPIVWTSLPLVQEAADAEKVEAVEGFWIPRPWLDSEACPPRRSRPAPATPTPPAAQTLGLAQVFEAGGSRLKRRSDRPYQTTRKLGADDPLPLTRAFHLVLEGRIGVWPDGRPVRCWSESPDHRPICLVAVDLQKVAFRDPETGDTLAEWSQ